MKYIDALLNRITMYRLTLLGLLAMAGYAVIASYFKFVQFTPTSLLLSLSILLVTCYIVNRLFALIYKAQTNYESTTITALILFFILAPPLSVSGAMTLVVAGSIAVISKYLLAFREKHLFNPAAIAAVMIGLFGLTGVSWWVATKWMVIPSLVVGLLVTRKIRRFNMVALFILTAVAVSFAKHIGKDTLSLSLARDFVLSWPVIFMGTIMLTEPLTTPGRKHMQLLYAVLVGILFSSGLHIGSYYSSPELALIFGNLFAYATLVRQRINLRLVNGRQLGGDVYELVFEPDRPFKFKSGQYADLTTWNRFKMDARGSRRTFSFASSPTESQVRIGLKFSNPSSSFKTVLANMHAGEYIYSSNVAGDFVLPRDQKSKLLFIAGGVGITPFRSMLQYLIDTNQQRDIVLLYSVSKAEELVYSDVLQAAISHGLKFVYILDSPQIPTDWGWQTGRIDQTMLARIVPDLKVRLCYISGPNVMIKGAKKALTSNGVKKRHIKTDYFTGY